MKPEENKIIKIAITGPESTGKSTLAEQLADHYDDVWVPEFARTYIEDLNRPYNQEDLLKIAIGQRDLERNLVNNTKRYIFCDTDPLVLKIWSAYRYGDTPTFINEEFVKAQYDLYLLMDIDLPWYYDPQREHPDKRQFFFNWFEKELRNKKANYHIVRGDQDDRLHHAIQIIEEQFS